MCMQQLTLILAALAAFFTLITGAFAVATTFFILYFAKLKKDREKEVLELVNLQDKVQQKLTEIEGGQVDTDELQRLKEDYISLRNEIFHYVSPQRSFNPREVQLHQMINDLLLQIASLQKQLAEKEPR